MREKRGSKLGFGDRKGKTKTKKKKEIFLVFYN